MKTFSAALLAALSLSLSGCVIAVGDKEFHDDSSKREKEEALHRSQISQFALGTSIVEVQGVMGVPDFSEALRGKAGEYRVLRYRTHHKHSDGDTTPDETTPLIFLDGKLYGIGEAAYAKAIAE